MKYQCYIVDDEPLAIKVIEQYLSGFDQFEICGKSTDPLSALPVIVETKPDLLFLDIAMPELTGLELIAAMQHKPVVILTTAYREYAVEGFELMVLDYLVKPIAFVRFVQAIDKFLTSRAGAPEKGSVDADHILIKADRKQFRVALSDILYMEGVKDYVLVVTASQRLITKHTMSYFIETLPASRFIQVHKSFVIAKDKITAWTAHEIEIGKATIPIGRVYKERFEQEMEQ